MNEQPAAPVESAPEVSTETQEWADALGDFAEENHYKFPEADEEQQPDEQQKPDDKQQKPDDKQEEQQTEQPQPQQQNNTVRDQRAIQRELQADQEAMHNDIREQMFPDIRTELRDADGDLIRTIEDVQKLLNPNTQQPFTEEEAAMWLLSAQQHIARTQEEANRQIEQIAEVNLSLKDGADAVRDKYGPLLTANPELRDRIWEQYQATLERDPKTDIITKAPVSIEKFYDTVLGPYSQLAAQQAQAQQQIAEQQKAHEQQVAKQTRADRSDIYAAGANNDLSNDDKEWAEAAKAVFN